MASYNHNTKFMIHRVSVEFLTKRSYPTIIWALDILAMSMT